MSDLLVIIVFAVYLAGVLLYAAWFFMLCTKSFNEWYRELSFPARLEEHIGSMNIDGLAIMYDSVFGVGQHKKEKFKERMRKALNKVYVKSLDNQELAAKINSLIEQVDHYSLLTYKEKDAFESIATFIDTDNKEDAKNRLKTLALLLQERNLALEKLADANSFSRKANLIFFFINLIIAGVGLASLVKSA